MTKKDYELTAAAIREQADATAYHDDPRAVMGAFTRRLAAALKADNPRFDTARFHAACEPRN